MINDQAATLSAIARFCSLAHDFLRFRTIDGGGSPGDVRYLTAGLLQQIKRSVKPNSPIMLRSLNKELRPRSSRPISIGSNTTSRSTIPGWIETHCQVA
jgi:hypothetical protein